MAINPSTNPEYNGQVEVPNNQYPYGSARNDQLPGDQTGTPRVASEVNDLLGFQQAILSESGKVPSGTPDNAQSSQYFDGLRALLLPKFTATTVTLAKNLSAIDSFVTSGYAALNDGGGAIWTATGSTVPGSAGTTDFANGVLYDSVGTEFKYDEATVRPKPLGVAADGATDDSAAMVNLIEFAVASKGTIHFNGEIIEVGSADLNMKNVDVVGNVYIKTARVVWSNVKRVRQSGGVFRCDDLYLSGVWYSQFSYLRVTSGTLFDGGGANWGSFWNKIGTLHSSLHLNASNHSVNHLQIENQRGGIYMNGGFAGNPLPQEIDNVVWEMADTTGANYTAADGRQGYQVLDERYEKSRTNRIKQLYAEVSGSCAVRGNFHIDGMTNIGPTSNLELPQWSHVLNTTQWTDRGSGDFFAGSPKSNLAVGGLWDILDEDGKPVSFSHANANAAVQADPTEPSGIGYSYGGSASISFSSLRIALKSSREGTYNVFMWVYAPDGLKSMQYERDGDPNYVGSNTFYWDRGDGWRLYRIAGNCRADGADEQLTIFIQGNSPTAPREVRLGGVWASPQKVAFLPCVVPEQDIKASVQSRPANGTLIALPVNGIAYNNDPASLAGSPVGWRKNSDGSFSEIASELPFAKSTGVNVTVPANTTTTLFTIRESTYNGGASGWFEIYWVNPQNSPDYNGATGYQRFNLALRADGDVGTHSFDLKRNGSVWDARGGASAPNVAINQTGNTWEIQATTAFSIGPSTAYVKATIYDSGDVFSFV